MTRKTPGKKNLPGAASETETLEWRYARMPVRIMKLS